jgi:opacity protein-like surface antigen
MRFVSQGGLDEKAVLREHRAARPQRGWLSVGGRYAGQVCAATPAAGLQLGRLLRRRPCRGGLAGFEFYHLGQGGSGIGAVGGAQAGCNVQWRQFVIGCEFWGSSLYDRHFNAQDSPDFHFNSDSFSRNRWDGAISVRSGVAFDRAFIYGKLGVVWGKFDYTRDLALEDHSLSIRGNAVIPGVLIGVGFEYALTDNWTTKFEYNYIDYGNKIVNFTETRCNAAVCVTDTFSHTVKERKQIAKIGINYKFDWGKGPVAVRAAYSLAAALASASGHKKSPGAGDVPGALPFLAAKTGFDSGAG